MTDAIHSKNASGIKGAYFDKNLNKWQSTAFYKKKKYFLGYFKTPEEAGVAYATFLESHKVIYLKNECSVCKEQKEAKDFYISKKTKSRHTSLCKTCFSKKNKLNYALNPEPVKFRNKKSWEKTQKNNPQTKERARRNAILKNYGISYESFVDMLKAQNGTCAICYGILRSGAGGLNIDHDHKTGIVRGVLCQKCNTGIGMFSDSISNLSSAINYLKRSMADA